MLAVISFDAVSRPLLDRMMAARKRNVPEFFFWFMGSSSLHVDLSAPVRLRVSSATFHPIQNPIRSKIVHLAKFSHKARYVSSYCILVFLEVVAYLYTQRGREKTRWDVETLSTSLGNVLRSEIACAQVVPCGRVGLASRRGKGSEVNRENGELPTKSWCHRAPN